MHQIILMDSARIERTLKRLSIQVWENQKSNRDLMIFGLNERGYATAAALLGFLKELTDQTIELHPFDVEGKGKKDSIPNCTDKSVLIVDDVIFSGKTMFNALSTICFSNEPSTIDVLTLVDRGHRMYPILSSLTGIEVPTKFGEHIEVILDNGSVNQVVLFKNS